MAFIAITTVAMIVTIPGQRERVSISPPAGQAVTATVSLHPIRQSSYTWDTENTSLSNN